MLHSWRWRKGRLKSTLMLHQSLSLWSNATSEVGMQSVVFFSYINRQTWSVRVFNKTATVPAPPTELHRSTDLLHHIVFWKHSLTQLKRSGGKKEEEEMAHYTDDGAWVKEDIWASVVYLSGDLCLTEILRSWKIRKSNLKVTRWKKKKDKVALMEFSTLTSN